MKARAVRLGLTYLLFLALCVDTLLYAIYGRASELVDSAAWLVLLGLFMLEALRERPLPVAARSWLRLARILATGLILWAALAYLNEAAWADAFQAWLWIAVIVLLEAELRWPPASAAQRRAYAVAAWALYGALTLLVFYWLWQGERLDAFDAALWLAAFFLIELDILSRMRPAPTSGQGAHCT